uniref:ATP synthase complex subunit 8 n=1 Tax=Gonopsis affinis TaxID=1874122 RepID=A0A343RQB1_9HEMI|nr:ATP synthase F0 subunit 8 [Gonopsis affinis]AUF71504.1 ATP synthase F0 subunit 8 [Gonopsis affinis]
MPQMAPMMWDLLFIYFMMSFMLMNILIYFMQKKLIKKMKTWNYKNNEMNWKW